MVHKSVHLAEANQCRTSIGICGIRTRAKMLSLSSLMKVG